jgi:hypothetical protein
MKRYINQNVRAKPAGSRMRSVARGKHVMRVAVTKNSARTGRGRLVSIMHPRSENPNLCKLRKNPGLELVILGANPGKKGAHKNALRKLRNPETEQVSGDGVKLYTEFHGVAPAEVIRVQESAEQRKEYVALGELVLLSGRWTDGGTFQIESDDIKLAANPEGTQLYFIGGSQAGVMNYLVKSGADTSKDLIEIGEATRVIYQTRKEMDQFRVANYDHKLGENGGRPPILFFDKVRRRLFLVGGTYQVRPEGIVN